MKHGTEPNIFGDRLRFAIEVNLLHDPDEETDAPWDSVGSWGRWRIWANGVNLCRMTLNIDGRDEDVDYVRWYLAPFFRWMADSWAPLLHESRLPGVGRIGDRRPRSAWESYVSALRTFGDEVQFDRWQAWSSRHSLRSCSEGGIVPDVMFQRIGDEIELSWGERQQPGAEFVRLDWDNGVLRAPFDCVADVMDQALGWFVTVPELKTRPWFPALEAAAEARTSLKPVSLVSWFVDSQEVPGRLTKMLLSASGGVRKWAESAVRLKWLAPLRPEVVMFGALSPEIDETAATALMGVILGARRSDDGMQALTDYVHSEPAWKSQAIWEQAYDFAEDLLDEADPDPTGPRTEIERLLSNLGVIVELCNLGWRGPRGAAIAGPSYSATIVVNSQNRFNQKTGGRRFTLAHELCHILYDQDLGTDLLHASTPWVSPSVERRANAFAAMLLMPRRRIHLQADNDHEELATQVARLADTLGTGKRALIPHLENIGEISEEEREDLQQRWYMDDEDQA